MATTKAQQRAVNKYMKANYDRVNLVLKKDESPTKAETQAAADAAGESLNSYIVGAVKNRMDGKQAAPDATPPKRVSKNIVTLDMDWYMRQRVEALTADSDESLEDFILDCIDERIEREEAEKKGAAFLHVRTDKKIFEKIREAAIKSGTNMGAYTLEAVRARMEAQSAPKKPPRRRAESKGEDAAPQQMELAALTAPAQSDADETAELKKRFTAQLDAAAPAVSESETKPAAKVAPSSNPEDDILTI